MSKLKRHVNDVYGLTVGGQVMYVGQTTTGARVRYLDHMGKARRGSTQWVHHMIRVNGMNVSYVILESGLSDEELSNREAYYIQQYGTIHYEDRDSASEVLTETGSISSISSLGSGWNIFARAGATPTWEIRKKNSEASKKNWEDPDYAARVIAGVSAACNTPQERNRRSKAQTERMKDPAAREAARRAALATVSSMSFEQKSLRGKRAMHIRWHVNEDRTSPDCFLCLGEETS